MKDLMLLRMEKTAYKTRNDTSRWFRFCRRVLDSDIAITGDAFPFFLYDSSVFDPDDAEVGLLRGETLIKVSLQMPNTSLSASPFQSARAVFSGPRSADKLTPGRMNGGRAPLTEIYRDRWHTITPENIAYIAVIVRQTYYFVAVIHCADDTAWAIVSRHPNRLDFRYHRKKRGDPTMVPSTPSFFLTTSSPYSKIRHPNGAKIP